MTLSALLQPFPDSLKSLLQQRETLLSLTAEQPLASFKPTLQSLLETEPWSRWRASSRQSTEAAYSGMWLWFGFLDRAHEICQDLPSAEGSYWHGIMHRIEGDYWNAKYWMRRVGKHSIHQQIAAQLPSLVGPAHLDPAIIRNLCPAGKLSAESFVDLCEQAAGKPNSSEAVTCQWIQAVEWQCLMLHCLSQIE